MKVLKKIPNIAVLWIRNADADPDPAFDLN
jgi:hypothetical protein